MTIWDKDRDKKRESQQQPQDFAEVTPPYKGSDYSFSLQVLVELQRSVGKLEQAVSTLTEEQKLHREKLDGLDKKMFAAIAILVLVGGVIGYFQNFTNSLLLKLLSQPQAVQTQQQTPTK